MLATPVSDRLVQLLGDIGDKHPRQRSRGAVEDAVLKQQIAERAECREPTEDRIHQPTIPGVSSDSELTNGLILPPPPPPTSSGPSRISAKAANSVPIHNSSNLNI